MAQMVSSLPIILRQILGLCLHRIVLFSYNQGFIYQCIVSAESVVLHIFSAYLVWFQLPLLLYMNQKKTEPFVVCVVGFKTFPLLI